ncbi:DUF3592 domain-containing protein [Cyanobacterium aponinum UTEX 3221]|uniref:DUF3592 domain-containing protein n=1 Tax=Cyanobacterium aponinum 0216 TaxID=2676140 RepID=A0A844H0H3_9CHRO|nr:DUF3592 domain-containing protein [Cyanobacterium aponinum]MTF39875.1 DUF3592 domain-containing protein [Cyanobacterium aponinum 0216]WRL40187.1 DUF3592 domain-containing protein [Cyanobacterium aponinum UTEX 3221]
MMENIVFFSIISIFILVGLGIILWGFSQQEVLVRSQKWPQTRAKITQLAFEDLSDVDGQSYVTTITYSYTVKGNSYQNSNIGFGYCASSGKEYHQRIYQVLAAKSFVNIYYDPRHPYKSVISKSPGKGIYISKLVGIFFVIWGLGFLILFIFSLSDFQFIGYIIRLGVISIMLITFVTVFISCWRFVDTKKIDQLTKDIRQC